jgi:hypothetical protein
LAAIPSVVERRYYAGLGAAYLPMGTGPLHDYLSHIHKAPSPRSGPTLVADAGTRGGGCTKRTVAGAVRWGP